MELKTKKRMVGAALLLGATIFTSSAIAQSDTAPAAGTGAGTITVQDVNYDQILDIITTGGPGNVLNVFLGNGDGTFNNIFQAGLGLGVQLGYIAAEDVPEITFYQNMMGIHLANTCCPDGGASAGTGDSSSMPSGLQIPDAASILCAPGMPVDLINLVSGGGNC